ncbi:hypothetical protein [Hyphomicrobium sp. DMF-1]|uniref:hypothetical protein n=1 Tax=Hyphomicrobium sp. DMF-1 TaxID=3019544 RepID=UPI0022EBDC36|nr:hypothetical protein [Hyphomicrobium sp. DMF-1]WBT37900.1 hypothetical protein PE058_19925 [Hyphomicrobium sp. DMF-1]
MGSASGHDGCHALGEGRGVIEKGEGGKVISSAGVIAATLAGSDENAGLGAHAGLGNADIDAFVMKGDLARNGDTGFVAAEVKIRLRPVKLGGQQLQPIGRCAVERGFLTIVVLGGPLPIEGLGSFGGGASGYSEI